MIIYIYIFELPPASLGYMEDKILPTPSHFHWILPTPSTKTAASSSLDQGFRRFPALVDALKELSQGLFSSEFNVDIFPKPAKSCFKTLQSPHLKLEIFSRFHQQNIKDLKAFHFWHINGFHHQSSLEAPFEKEKTSPVFPHLLGVRCSRSLNTRS